MEKIVKLATSGLPNRPCSTCLHWFPAYETHGRFRTWSEYFQGKEGKPTSRAAMFATCGAFGGGYANICRKHDCHGKMWEPKGQ